MFSTDYAHARSRAHATPHVDIIAITGLYTCMYVVVHTPYGCIIHDCTTADASRHAASSCRKRTVTVLRAQLLYVFDGNSPSSSLIHDVRRRVAHRVTTPCRTVSIGCTRARVAFSDSDRLQFMHAFGLYTAFDSVHRIPKSRSSLPHTSPSSR